MEEAGCIMRKEHTFVLAILLLMALFPASLCAQWVENGVAICTETMDQEAPYIVSDGWGGVVIVWVDHRSWSRDIYAQRVDRYGYPLWTPDGIEICTNTDDQTDGRLVQDGTGGAIIIWLDYRDGDPIVYTQRINSDGTMLWASDGFPVCTEGAPHSLPWIIADDAGGAIIVWGDNRAGEENTDIYAQRIDADGNVLWPAAGLPICSASGNQYYQSLIADGAGGAIVVWTDYRSGEADIYAQRIDAGGNPLWTIDGVAVCSSEGTQWLPRLASDGKNGAVVAFSYDLGFMNTDIYAQRIDAEGNIRWAPEGVPICTAWDYQWLADMIYDDCGGAIIIWQDDRNLPGSSDLYAQRVDTTGSVLWTADGVLCTTYAGSPTLISDGSCGAIISFKIVSGYGQDIIAQRIDSDGNLLWTGNGTTVCTQTSMRGRLGLVTDGAGGGIVAWCDDRVGLVWREANHGLTNNDVRAIELWFDYVFAGTFGGGVFRADENEAKWSVINNGLTNLNVQDIETYGNLWVATNGGVFRSLDYGDTWEEMNNGLTHLDVRSLLFRSSDLGFAGTYGGGVYRTMNGGDSWTQVNNGIAHMDVNMLAYNTGNAQVLAGSNGGGLYASADSGNSWIQLNNGLTNLDVRAFEYKFASDYIFIGTYGGGVFRSLDNGEHWEQCNTGLTNLNVYAFEVYTYVRHLFVGTDGGGVFMSTDDGDSWEPINDGLTELRVCDFTSKNLKNYYAATSGGGVFRYEIEYDIYAHRITADGDPVISGSELTQPMLPALNQNYPNPFNPTTRIRFDLPRAVHVKLSIYNVKGELVSTIVDQHMSAGRKEVTWSATDNRGRSVASGIYFYRLVADDFVQTKKMVLLR